MSLKISKGPDRVSPEFYAVIDIRTGVRVGMSLYRTRFQALADICRYEVKGVTDPIVYELLPFLDIAPVLFDDDDDYIGGL